MRSLPIWITVIIAAALMGVGLKTFPFPTAVASEVLKQEDVLKAAPKFPRKPLLSSSVEIWLGRSHGSGVQFAPGYFLTAGHVAALGDAVFTLKAEDGSTRKGIVLWANKAKDVALIAADGDGLSISPLSCDLAAVGDEITIHGSPMQLGFATTYGRIAALPAKRSNWESAYVVDAAAAPGNSGGAVLNRDGQIVGLLVGGYLNGYGGYQGLVAVVDSKTVCQLLARQ